MARALLVVDDIKSNREILKNILGGDYEIIEAEHGQEALAVMNEEYARLSAVLLDLGMPVMDGYEVLSAMRDSDALSQLPVIVTTGQTDSDSEERALKLGAKDYISKPYKSAIIKQRIWNTIYLRETAAAVNTLQKDALTGLWNRETFFRKASAEIAAQPAGHFMLACVDIDGFKIVNDQYGNDTGDKVLKSLAEALRCACEENNGVCGRIFADRFVCLYRAGLENTGRIYPKLLEDRIYKDTGLRLTLSVGRYAVTDKDLGVSAMYDRASIAQSTVKGRYDKHVAVYSENMRSHIVREQKIVGEMSSALANGQFEVWYQPQYNHSTKALIGSEALVRWRHPKSGLIFPGVFVPIFEENGFIYELDKYVWENVCRYLRSELCAGRSPLPVSVNISRYDVFREDFFECITGLTAKYEVPVGLLRLEITESAFAESTSLIVDMVKKLIDFGFTLEIDDFGSGYSSLNTLKSVPAQVVKLDMRFLEDDDDSQRGGNIIESVVRMTKWLGMSVIAEGVERKTQADYLRSIGCNYVQGYLYAKPMIESDYRALCGNTGKEEKLLSMEAVENLDNNSFWNPESMDTLIFNSYVGAACVFEFHNGNIEVLRASEKFAQLVSGASMTVDDALRFDWVSCLDGHSKEKLKADLEESVLTKSEITGEYVFIGLPGHPHDGKLHLRSTLRVIASVGDRWLVYCTNENITAQRSSEQRERETSEQLKAVLDNVACGITAITADKENATYIIANNTYYELLGFTPEQYRAEVNGRAFSTIYPADLARVLETIERVRATEKPETIEYRVVRRDGKVIWLRSIISMADFLGVDGKVQLNTYTDITLRKQAEQELLDATAQLQAMMDDMPGGFARLLAGTDGKFRPTYFNEGFCRLVGLSRDELIGTCGEDAFADVHPDDETDVRKSVSRALKDGTPCHLRYRRRHGVDGYILLNVFGRVTKDSAGESFLNVYYTDASEQLSEETFRRELLDNLPEGAGLFSYDAGKLGIVYLNARYWQLVGRPPVPAEELSPLSYVHPDDLAVIESEIPSAIDTGRDISCDIRLRNGENGYTRFHLAGRIVAVGSSSYSIYAAFTPASSKAMSVQEMLPIALGAVMNSQNGYAFVKDKAFRYICASRETAAVIGLTESQMLGKTDYELFEKSLADEFTADDRRILESGESVLDAVNCLTFSDGQNRYLRTSKYPLKDALGNIIGVYGIGYDVTGTHAMESQLQLLTNSIPGGLASYVYENKRMRLTYFSDGYCEPFGLSREEYAALTADDVFAGIFSDDLCELKAQLDALIDRDVQVDCVFRVRLHDGSQKWVNLKASVSEREENRVSLNAVIFDVTRREEAAERIRISEQENRLAMQHTKNAVCRYDIAARTLRIPSSFAKKFSLPEMLTDVPEGSIACGDISQETLQAYRLLYSEINDGSPSGTAVFQRKSQQGWRWLEAHYSTIFSDSNQPVSAVISFSDITEQLEKDTAYKRWQQSFLARDPKSYSLFRCSVGKKIRVFSHEGSLLTVNFKTGEPDFYEYVTRYTAQLVAEDDRERFTEFFSANALLTGYYQGKRMTTLEYREVLADGTVRWLRLTADLVEHPRSSDIEAYLLFEDIDEAKRQQLSTIKRAESDPLTGVMNRTTFAARVNAALEMAGPDSHHALLMIDIDSFKQVNDAFGHGAGDQALIDVSEALRRALRHDDLIGRLGGDEFLVFLSGIPGDVVAADKAKRICAMTRRTYSAEVDISASVGISVAPRDGNDFDTLYKKADAALYHVKGSGKDNFMFYSEDMSSQHLALEPDTADDGAENKPRKKRRMLIVDDSRIDHALLTGIFSDDFIIEKAKDAESALIRLRHYGSAVSIVLLDLIMPGMDGFEVLKKMRESTELRNVPVIVVSGDEDRETALRAIREGAVDFVSKPVDPEVLRARVSSAVSRAENERLRAKSSLLEYRNAEVVRCKNALEHSGVVVVEHDWVSGTFVYDPAISKHLAGRYDGRDLWHILLSDLVAEPETVQHIQEMVRRISDGKTKSAEVALVRLKSPSGEFHCFRVSAYKTMSELGLAGKIYLAFVDVDKNEPVTGGSE